MAESEPKAIIWRIEENLRDIHKQFLLLLDDEHTDAQRAVVDAVQKDLLEWQRVGLHKIRRTFNL